MTAARKLWIRVNVIACWPILWLIDAGIALTTEQTFKNARAETKTTIKEIWG